MAKTKVYMLAKELGMTVKKLMQEMTDLGLSHEFRSHMSSLSEDTVAFIKINLRDAGEEKSAPNIDRENRPLI